VRFLRFSQKRQDGSSIFSGFTRKNTCLLQPALKSTAGIVRFAGVLLTKNVNM